MTENSEAPGTRRPSDDDVEGHIARRPEGQLGEEAGIDDVEGHIARRPEGQLGEESGGDDVQGHIARRP